MSTSAGGPRGGKRVQSMGSRYQASPHDQRTTRAWPGHDQGVNSCLH